MKNQLTKLKWFDIAILTLILFSYAIYTSFLHYVTPLEGTNYADITAFSAEDNVGAFILQSLLLFMAFLYLKWRNFHFGVWNIGFSFQAVGKGILLFIIVALCMDLYFILLNAFLDLSYVEETLNTESIPHFAWINFPLIPYAMLNGVYEELFFLGICLSVDRKYLPIAFIYSLIIRVSFHTYQGMETAIGIGLILGSLFFLLYQKSKQKDLFPFFVAHAIADIFGAGVISYFY
ncbi:CPBP family glutamic-type intramembrane protease [Pasteurella multocida]|uniref:CPBP family glutamic-type intramembrane protease n=1 Tax=Pasteurella multocida TaxID=747 RepID=UPI0020203A30|nr:CPBP family glutamic-type intramembrane protease [Pasteurella multocida]MCL7798791.1 CPBP family intramembrane metalloprotease [Pasteurella multocida]MCL7805152.1 CPBP family intramembrane metalloprotease [Pasteurella multocida]MCL7808410.1 CPBP family intramembrane metalloprotease [Pasteurella multocida]MCL7809876.1 CPBP family intramembrane metalloprotease [Pasteurella multocida]MCL7813173.1 CPBP family intramembrane metalloprotease [Pasteurella multocida]